MAEYRIVTVTLNPAIDRVVSVPQFRVGVHAKAKRVGWYPAGKGINVSRVLATLGTRSIATGLVGEGELAIFEEYLEHHGHARVTTQLLSVRGRTRDNITVVDPVDDTETHLRDEGFTVQREDMRRIMSKVGMLAREEAVVAFCGSLPPGATTGDLRTMLHRCDEAGAHAVIDTSEQVLADLRDEPVWMVKVNAKELETLTGMPTGSEQEAVEAARSILRSKGGSVEYVVATRGADGAILLGPGVCLSAKVAVHPGLIANTVGCGDALLAGLLAAYVRGADWDAALKRGVATATANAVSRTPGVIEPDDIRQYAEMAILAPPTAA
ncbi:MAG: hexose kinase [Phycisphaerales bacterium]|nr:hexose kinase [Phycisphaerales bacterium]